MIVIFACFRRMYDVLAVGHWVTQSVEPPDVAIASIGNFSSAVSDGDCCLETC